MVGGAKKKSLPDRAKKKSQWTSSSTMVAQPPPCPICFTDINDMSEFCQISGCGHSYHITCWFLYFNTNIINPICCLCRGSTNYLVDHHRDRVNIPISTEERMRVIRKFVRKTEDEMDFLGVTKSDVFKTFVEQGGDAYDTWSELASQHQQTDSATHWNEWEPSVELRKCFHVLEYPHRNDEEIWYTLGKEYSILRN